MRKYLSKAYEGVTGLLALLQVYLANGSMLMTYVACMCLMS